MIASAGIEPGPIPDAIGTHCYNQRLWKTIQRCKKNGRAYWPMLPIRQIVIGFDHCLWNIKAALSARS
jgi:hypothetical protein